MISSEAAKVYDVFRNAPKQVDMDLHQREAGEHAEDITSEPVGIEYQDVPELGGLWVTPRNSVGDAAIMYLYGGYVISSPHSRRKLGGHLANASGRTP